MLDPLREAPRVEVASPQKNLLREFFPAESNNWPKRAFSVRYRIIAGCVPGCTSPFLFRPSMKGASEVIPQAQRGSDDTMPSGSVGHSTHFKRECKAPITPVFNEFLLEDNSQRTTEK